MIIGHRSARRRFLPYLSGTLAPGKVRALEAHLAECGPCRSAFVRLKEGHRLAARLPGIEESLPLAEEEGVSAPVFSATLAEAGRGGVLKRKWNGMRVSWSLAASAPRTVWILATVVIFQAALLVVLNRDALFEPEKPARATLSGIDIHRFQILDIAELPGNVHPHIATEGYVRSVWMDDEEKTLHFKLASSPEGDGPYVICEILSPDRISAPRAGNRVRVYGLARYDAQAGRRWHEVNPVLNISYLNR